MITTNLKKSCEQCKCADLRVKETDYYESGGLYETGTFIGCYHMNVCAHVSDDDEPLFGPATRKNVDVAAVEEGDV